MKDIFGINKLILINVEHSNYVEAVLTHEILNFSSRNGVGKTSKIKTLKMILSPEDNFKKSKLKFNIEHKVLRGEDENYNNYKYYFRDQRSFIICEHVNSYGVFCQILSRTILPSKELGITRFFIDKDYETIKEWFMSEENAVGVATKINNMELAKKIEENGGVIANEKSFMTNVMFNSYPTHKNGKRYNIVDLKGTDDIALFGSVLDMILKGMNEDTIRNIIIKVCENTIDKSEIKGDRGIDIRTDIIPGFIAIKESIEDYTLKLNLKAKYIGLKNSIEKYSGFIDINKRVLPESIKLKNKKEEINKSFNDINQKINIVRDVIENYKKKRSMEDGIYAEKTRSVDKKIEDNKIKISKINEDIKEYDKTKELYLKTLEQIYNENDDDKRLSVEEIISKIKRSILLLENIEQDPNYSELENLKIALKNIEKDISQKNNLIKHYQREINSPYIDLSEEDLNNISIFNTIFENKISTQEFIENKEIINKLNNEFIKIENNKIYIGNKELGVKSKIEKTDKAYIIKTINVYEEELKKLMLNKKEKTEMVNEEIKIREDYLKDAQNNKREIEKLKLKLKIIQSLSPEYTFKNNNNKDKILDLEKENVNLKSENLTNNKEYNIIKEGIELKIVENSGIYSEIDIKLKKINNELKDIKIYEDNIEEIKRELIFTREKIEVVEKDIDGSCDFDIEFFRTIKKKDQERKELLNHITRELKSFLSENILLVGENEWLNYSDQLTYQQIKKSFTLLSNIFENIEEKYKLQKIENEKSKDSLLESISLLLDMDKIIKSNIKHINSIIQKNIQNVSSIDNFEIELEGDKVIKELCEKITFWKNENKNNYFDTDKFDSIISYLSILANNKGGIIKYGDFIKNIHTVFSQNGQKSRSGSTGTNIILNIIFISSVFDKLIQESSIMQLPIIVDEIGALDSNNKRLLIDIVKEKNYRLISTTPELDFFDPDFPEVDMLDINLQSLMTRESELTTAVFDKFEDRQTYFYSQRKEIDFMMEKKENDEQ